VRQCWGFVVSLFHRRGRLSFDGGWGSRAESCMGVVWELGLAARMYVYVWVNEQAR